MVVVQAVTERQVDREITTAAVAAAVQLRPAVITFCMLVVLAATVRPQPLLAVR
jgi:hypothetical protein